MASKKKHWILTSIAAFMGCEDYLDPLWCLKPYKSSSAITELVRGYIETWKSEHRKEAAVDNRGHWTLKKQLGCDVNEMLRESIQKPFDESVLLWHLATEFCYSEGNSNTGSAATSNSRVISNYMVYLLFINPEMLMTGTRPSLFRDEYERLNGMLPDGEPTQELGEAELAKKIIQKLKGGAKDTCVADDASSLSGEEELCIAEDAWALSEELMKLCKDDDEKNMWAVIEGVWVEMLCFSASRCRGYLHAKSLGKGGEYLSYIWLLLWVTGIKTLSEKTQRTPELPKQQGDKPVTPVIGVKERDEDTVTPVIGDEIV
ncbi:hypothetical protein HU200_049055 [Digitaria exilis]|uniref:DUF4220 domain-containing protein n=1 Tax=Digitaria exilis TaxID=1010633 RepID=A0A835ARR1_9POAL|nr:hypothetical protein HU200_049055 [Digitaria exilis]